MSALFCCLIPKKRQNSLKRIGSITTPYGTMHLSIDGSVTHTQNSDQSLHVSPSVKKTSYIRNTIDLKTTSDMLIDDDYTMHTNNPYIDAHFSQRRASLVFYKLARSRSSQNCSEPTEI